MKSSYSINEGQQLLKTLGFEIRAISSDNKTLYVFCEDLVFVKTYNRLVNETLNKGFKFYDGIGYSLWVFKNADEATSGTSHISKHQLSQIEPELVSVNVREIKNFIEFMFPGDSMIGIDEQSIIF